MNRKLTLGIIVLIFATLGMISEKGDDLEDYPYLISLGNVSFTPAARKINVKHPGHFIIQFYEIPSQRQLKELSKLGIEISRYIEGNAYIAEASRLEKIKALTDYKYIRAAADITPAMRLHPDFNYVAALGQSDRKNDIISADIRFHKSVSFKQARELLSSLGINCDRERYLASQRLIVKAPRASILRLLEADEVDEIGPALLKVRLMNKESAKRMRVDKVLYKRKYHSPSGEGVLVGVTDSWTVDENNVEFEDRVTILHDTSYIETPQEWAALNHASFVAGTIAAVGVNRPEVRGVAPSARILSFIIPYDPVDEIAYAANNLGMRISCNSWSVDYEDDFFPPYRLPHTLSDVSGQLKSSFGYYPNFNYAMDEMVHKDDVLYVWAAGNDASVIMIAPYIDEWGSLRTPDAWHRTYPTFDNLTVNSSGKNVLAIGATHKDNVITAFSSRGPGYNGRIGPHLVAPGWRIISTNRDNKYGEGSGTSGAAPMASGVSALLLHQHKEIHQTEPSSAILKALLINSARDLGLKGPDYTYGFGLVDAELAARTISGQEGIEELKMVKSRLIEDTIEHKQTDIYNFEVPKGKTELRITLVWHDHPGRRLINNLDLWARFGSEKKILPLTPNPKDPLDPAQNKRNSRDTAEHIVIENPQAGTWTIFVKGKKVPKGLQTYALVIAASKGNEPMLKLNDGEFTIERVVASHGDVNQPQNTFQIGGPAHFHVLLNVHENASYPDGFYGTVTARFELWNESGYLKYVLTTSFDLAPSESGELRELRWFRDEIPEGIVTGTFRVKTIVTMHNGLTKTAPEEIEITIQ